MGEVSIGFDLGVSSVGWAIFDLKSEKVIDRGVKLFEQANKAVDRRNSRALRRRYHRADHRAERLAILLKEYKLPYIKISDRKLLEKRIYGLKNKLEEQDLTNVLYFLLKYRGYQPFGKETRENSYNTKEENKKLYVCEIQEKILKEEGHYRGTEFPFMVNEFQRELEQILDIQIKLNKKLDNIFKEKILEIYQSRRKFWEGPGGPKENQLTSFGRYKNKMDLEKYQQNPNYNKYLYEELIKNCSVYIGEKSVPVSNYYAERFNFLNDMINLRINGEDINEDFINKLIPVKIDKSLYQLRLETINEIEREIFSSAKAGYKSIFKKVLGIDSDKLKGYRIDRVGKAEISKFTVCHSIQNKLKAINSSFQIHNDIDIWNKIVYFGTVVPKDQVENMLIENIGGKFNNEELDIFANYNYENRYHSFSEKALKKYIKLMEENLLNSSTIERNFKEEIGSDVHEKIIENYFPNSQVFKMQDHLIDNLVASPQVKKTLRKAITTLNEIRSSLKDEYQIRYIVVESNKELLSDKKKLEYIKNQGENEKLRNKAKKLYGNDETKIMKHLLLEESDHKCVYCDKNITMQEMSNMEIEHILPISKTADDSFGNKAASCYDCNHKKGNKTPYQFFIKVGYNWEEFTNRVKKNKKFGEEKVKNLLFSGDINKYEKKFINRNLRDTSYATNEFVKQIKIYKEALQRNYKLKNDFEIIAMPPKITGKIRKRIKKDRSLHYHHAVDGIIAAAYATTYLGRKSADIQNNPESFYKMKVEDYIEDLENNIKNFYFNKKIMGQLQETDYKNTRFHFEIKKKNNGQLANADISKVLIKEDSKKRKVYQRVGYIENIYELDDTGLKKLEKMFADNSPKILGIRKRDKETYEFIKKIYEEYKDLKWRDEKGKETKINPFKYYACKFNEEGEVTPSEFKVHLHGIRPKSKKNKKRPIIKKLKYIENVTNPYVYRKEKMQFKENNYLMMQSLAASYTIVYKNLDKGGYLFMPIYLIMFDLKKGKLNVENKYYQELYKQLIGDTKVEKLFDIRANMYLKIQSKNGEIIEGRFSSYEKGANALRLKNKKRFYKNDLSIEIIPIYKLGRYNVNLEGE